MRQQSFAEERYVTQYSGTAEMARRFDRGLVVGGSAGLAVLVALGLLDLPAVRFGFGALFAAGAAYLFLGPAMTVTIRLLAGWLSPRS